MEVYHTPWTHADSHVFEATSGYGVNVRDDSTLDAATREHLGAMVGEVLEGAHFGNYDSQAPSGVQRVASVVSRGTQPSAGVSHGPAEVLKLSAASELCHSLCPAHREPLTAAAFPREQATRST